ncbi:hypothetical protein [Rhizorhabdus histidinilytica]|uniref:hypothetical protein n=1 Tax=Rhizorhabdus histidinilytica TaxID=439228 RepID=UPI00321F903E
MQKMTKIFMGLAALLLLYMCSGIMRESRPGAPDPADKISVRADPLMLWIDNQTGEKWSDCEWTLNGDFEYGADLDRQEAGYPLRAFADDSGVRFGLDRKLKSLHIHCRKPRTLTVYRTWK